MGGYMFVRGDDGEENVLVGVERMRLDYDT